MIAVHIQQRDVQPAIKYSNSLFTPVPQGATRWNSAVDILWPLIYCCLCVV